MTGHWQWEDDALWQACSAEARQQASGWAAQILPQYAALEKLAAQQPLVAIAQDDAKLKQCIDEAAALASEGERLVVIGTGGATLGAQALCALSDDPARVRFLENCDPVTLESFFKFPKESTVWCIVSKSGETVETLATALALIAHYNDPALLRKKLRVITSAKESTLQRLVRAEKWTVLPHPAGLGGRYSVFSIVGLLPAAFAGLPVADIARDAAACMQQLLRWKDPQLFAHASWFAANMATKPIHLLMGYADRLRAATQWYKQLWAESLGKDGKGATPVTAIGAIDQHSQLQLYLDGPRDKLLTLWLPEVKGIGPVLPAASAPGAEYLKGHRMGDVMDATAEATVTTLRNAGVPLRVLRGKLTPQSLGSWMARQMLETLLVAQLIGVDPWSQPAVESGKKLTRAALGGGV